MDGKRIRCLHIGTPFGTEKLEWCRYPMLKKFEDIFIRFGATPERDRQTDGHRVIAYTALMHMHLAVRTETVWLLDGEEMVKIH